MNAVLDLKPCPFCGAKPRLQTDFRFPRHGKYAGQRITAYEVVCDTLVCPIYHADNTYFMTEEKAVKSWNRRVNE